MVGESRILGRNLTFHNHFSLVWFTNFPFYGNFTFQTMSKIGKLRELENLLFLRYYKIPEGKWFFFILSLSILIHFTLQSQINYMPKFPFVFISSILFFLSLHQKREHLPLTCICDIIILGLVSYIWILARLCKIYVFFMLDITILGLIYIYIFGYICSFVWMNIMIFKKDFLFHHYFSWIWLIKCI